MADDRNDCLLALAAAALASLLGWLAVGSLA
jgi:hypothetical protein